MLLLSYAALVAQISQREGIAVGGVSPDFLALVLLAAAFWLNGTSAVAWAALSGLLADCLASTQPGIRMLIATLLVAGVQTCIGPEWRKSGFVQVLLGFALVCALLTGTEVAHLLLAHQPIVFPKIWSPLVSTALYTSALAIGLRTVWKTASRIVPVRSTEPRPTTTGRWDALSR
nr:hypothetical protein [uncultured bacterium]